MPLRFVPIDEYQDNALRDERVQTFIDAMRKKGNFAILASLLSRGGAISDGFSAAFRLFGLDPTVKLKSELDGLSEMMRNQPSWLAAEEKPEGALRGAVFEGFCRHWCAEHWRPKEVLEWGCYAEFNNVTLFHAKTVDVGYSSAAAGYGEFKISNDRFRDHHSFRFFHDLEDALARGGVKVESIIALSLSSSSMLRAEAQAQGCLHVEIFGLGELRASVEGRGVRGVRP